MPRRWLRCSTRGRRSKQTVKKLLESAEGHPLPVIISILRRGNVSGSGAFVPPLMAQRRPKDAAAPTAGAGEPAATRRGCAGCAGLLLVVCMMLAGLLVV